MGYGPFYGGRHHPITPVTNSWAAQVNRPTPQHIRDAHADQFAATHTQRLVLPGRVDIRGNRLPDSNQWPIGGV